QHPGRLQPQVVKHPAGRHRPRPCIQDSVPLRTWIIDDEELARARLRLLLRDCPSVQVLREFTSAQAAVPQLLVDQPDLIFLDVRMPGMTGMEFATSLKNEYRVAIIFVTAFEEFA